MSDETNTETAAIPTFAPEDLVAAVMLIDAACNEGAYKGWENIQKAFTVRNKLLMFAQKWSETAKAAEENNETENANAN